MGITVKVKPGVVETTPPCGITQAPGGERPTAFSTAITGIAPAKHTIPISPPFLKFIRH